MKLLIIPVFAIIFLASCTKDRDVSTMQKETDSLNVTFGLLKVNEFVAKGSSFVNEYGTLSDWFEIFNTSNQTINMRNGKWYVTDDLTNPRKYELPAVSIAPRGFLIVCCDGLNKYGTQIHSNFNLSASGEQIGIFYAITNVGEIPVDTLSYPEMTEKGFSYGRLPDGTDNWSYFAIPTPGKPNHY